MAGTSAEEVIGPKLAVQVADQIHPRTPAPRWRPRLRSVSLSLSLFIPLPFSLLFLLPAETSAATNAWSAMSPPGTPPGKRAWHVGVLVEDKMFVHGGQYNYLDGHYRDEIATFLNDIHAYDLSTNAWSGPLSPSGTTPSSRCSHSGVVDGVNIIVFGGRVADSPFMNDLHAYNTQTNTWSVLSPSGTPPTGRFGHTAVIDITTRTMYIYGGISTATPAVTNDLHSYNAGSDEWSALSPSGSLPPVTYGHNAVFDIATRTMWVLVGYGVQHAEDWGSAGHMNDVWSYDVQGNRWSKVTQGGTAPSSFYYYDHGAIFWVDAAILAWEPKNPQTMRTYDVQTNAWSSATASGTLPTNDGGTSLYYACAVYSSARRKMLLFGGYLPVYLWQSAGENNFFAYAPPATTTSTGTSTSTAMSTGTSSTSTTTSTASNTSTSMTTTSTTKTTSTTSKKTRATTTATSTTETTTVGTAVAAGSSRSVATYLSLSLSIYICITCMHIYIYMYILCIYIYIYIATVIITIIILDGRERDGDHA